MTLQITIGQHSDPGRKSLNQDFHGLVVPQEPLLTTKGVAIAIADGISSSEVSQIASATSVKGFLDEYYATPEAWTVKTSVQRVLAAANSWLYAQTRNGPHRYEIERGYVCTFSAMVFKSTSVYLFHVGDTRVYRLSGNSLEQLTEDHRTYISKDKSYLNRALGMRDRIEIDYQAFPVDIGDVFISATDGVYEFVDEKSIIETIGQHQGDLNLAARSIIQEALKRGSDDNLTIQILRIEQLPGYNIEELYEQVSLLPFPPELRARTQFDGFEILRELHHSHRSHLYLAQDLESQSQVVLKVPSVDLRDDPAYIERFLMEEWVARRLDNAHLLKHCEMARKRHYLYTVTEYIEGQTLYQWMMDHPGPDLETVRNLVEQISRGLYALHRQEMLHQDLRPANIMIDNTGTVKLIDFGSVRVAGVAEIQGGLGENHILGTAQYSAPEYFLGRPGSTQSDLFSLGVIAYQMLSGQLPYGTQVAKSSSQNAQYKLHYQSLLASDRSVPIWVDEAIRKAVHPNPQKRYSELSEFVYDLRHPNAVFLNKHRPPLLDRNPVLFWKGLSLILLLIIIYLLSPHPF